MFESRLPGIRTMSKARDEKLEESLGRDQSKIRKAEMFRRCLSDTGFERYVANFYETVENVSPDVRASFGEAPIDASGRYWKNGEKVTILVQCRHGGGATDDEGRRYVEKHEIEEFFAHVSPVRKAAGHDVHLICVTSVWFSKEARDFCHAKRIAAIDFSGLLAMDEAYPLERFIKEIAERQELEKCFSLFWLGKYLPEYAKTERAVRRARLESKALLGSLMAEVEATVVKPTPAVRESERPATIFDAPETLKRNRFKTAAVGFAAFCACAWLITEGSRPGSSGTKIATSAVESRETSTGSSFTGSEREKANSASARRQEVRERRAGNSE